MDAFGSVKTAHPANDGARHAEGQPLARPGWAEAVLTLLLYLQLAAGGANDGPGSALAAIAQAGAVIAILLTVPPTSRFWHHARVPLYLLAGALAWAAIPALLPASLRDTLGMAEHPAPDLFVLEWSKAAAAALTLTIAALLGYRAGTARALVQWIAAAGVIYLGYAAIDAIDWLADSQHGTRYAGTIGNTNAAGIVFAAIALLGGGVALAPEETARWQRIGALAATGVALILCAMTGSRSAILLAVLLGVVMLALRRREVADRHLTWRRMLPGTLLLVALMIAAAMLTPVANRSGYLPEDAASRGAIIAHYAAISAEAPIWGFGAGSFFAVNLHTLTSGTAPLYWNFGAAHNAPLQAAIEIGWPGLLLNLGAIGAILFAIARARRDWWSTVALCAIGAIAGSAMIDIALNVPAIVALTCLLLGGAWGAALRSGSRARRRQAQRHPHRDGRVRRDREQAVTEAAVEPR